MLKHDALFYESVISRHEIEVPSNASWDNKVIKVRGHFLYVLKANFSSKTGQAVIKLNDTTGSGIVIAQGMKIKAPFQRIFLNSGTLKINAGLQPGLILMIGGSPAVDFEISESFHSSDFTVDLAAATAYDIEGAVNYIYFNGSGDFEYTDLEGTKTIAVIAGTQQALQPQIITSNNAVPVTIFYKRAQV